MIIYFHLDIVPTYITKTAKEKMATTPTNHSQNFATVNASKREF
jgi:hypothetical protein